jgi:lipopolysaccharide export system protein LptA
LLVGAGLLVLVLAAFLGYAHYRAGRVIANLPGKLGATVTKEFNGYTYSQSDGKRTIFTIHAAKAMQHQDGKYLLHDVSMILYGHSGDRADRISGDEFEYDTQAQVVKAIGVVHLDLDASAPAGAADSNARKHLAGPALAEAQPEDAKAGSHVIHVKTSGLVYVKQSGMATTDQGLEFAFGGYTGHAVGAVYDSTNGHVVLQSAVTVSGVDKGRPIALSAAHGELDRIARRADFKDARYSSAGQVARSEVAQIYLREDNSVERIECVGKVTLEDGVEGKATSDKANVLLDAANRPKSAVLTGAVRFSQDGPLKESHGESERANLDFDGQGHLAHALLQGKVTTLESVRTASAAAASQRSLTSDGQEIWLAPQGGDQRPQVRDVKATGSVRLDMSGAAGDAQAARRFTGDLLTAHMVPVKGTPELSTVHGIGHTEIEQTGVDGVFQKSTGDTLDAKFRPAEAAAGKSSAELVSAVQQGGVAIERRVPAKIAGGDAEVQHATAKTAAYDADSDRLTLTGDVAMNDVGRQILAARVVMAQRTGDATADGGVRVTYQQAGSTEPVHVLAARAELNHAAGRAVFYGRAAGAASAGLARLWQAGTGGQGGSQIEAPVLVFEGTGAEGAGGKASGAPQKGSRLIAHGETPDARGQVRTVLAEAGTKGADSQPKGAGSQPNGRAQAKAPGSGVARIVSSEMVYSDVDRRAEFSGGVRLVDASGVVQAQDAVVFLLPREPAGATGTAKKSSAAGTGGGTQAAAASGLLGGSVERVVATQHIEMTQPGRKATGERLVYTASDQMFVLTGTPSVPPRVVDAQQGSTTGAALRFHSGDNSVVISGADGNAPARKVETETRVKR